MSEKKYLLTESDISKIGQLECESCAANAAGRFDCSEALDAERHRMLESHEYRERTCRAVSHSVFCGSFGCEEAGERWELSCGHEALTEYDRPGYCPECGARLVEP